MTARPRSFAAAALLTLLAALPVAASAIAMAPGDYELPLRHGGRNRYYLAHVPPQASTGRALPVVFAFHGGGGDPKGMQENYGLDAVADREGFIVAYPAGTGRLRKKLLTWNAGTCCGYAVERNVDDVGFTVAVLDHLAARIPVDRARVYATGHSNGGMLSWRLAAEVPELIAAVAPVAGCIAPPATPPRRRVPILSIHSVDDPRALYAGGWGPPFPMTNNRSWHGNVPAMLAAWARFNGCSPDSHVVETLAADSVPGRAAQSAELLRSEPLTGNAPVMHWRLRGVGHGWPGQTPMLPERLMGPSTMLIDAAEEAWRFFKAFSVPIPEPEDVGR